MIYKVALWQAWVNKNRAICTVFIYAPLLSYRLYKYILLANNNIEKNRLQAHYNWKIIAYTI